MGSFSLIMGESKEPTFQDAFSRKLVCTREGWHQGEGQDQSTGVY